MRKPPHKWSTCPCADCADRRAAYLLKRLAKVTPPSPWWWIAVGAVGALLLVAMLEEPKYPPSEKWRRLLEAGPDSSRSRRTGGQL